MTLWPEGLRLDGTVAYNSEVKRINKILKELPEFFTFKTFISVYNRLYDDKLVAAEDLANYVVSGYLEQIVRVELPSGKIKEYKSILDIPDNIYDTDSGKNFIPGINDITIVYKQFLKNE